jgi:hypothetical protein
VSSAKLSPGQGASRKPASQIQEQDARRQSHERFTFVESLEQAEHPQAQGTMEEAQQMFVIQEIALRSVPMVLLQTEGALTASGGKQLFF